MAKSFGFLRSGSFGSGPSWERSSMGDEDFDEEDVWAVVNEKTDPSTPKGRKPKDPSSSSSSPILTPAKRFPTASRMIPRAINSLPTKETKLHQQSAPVNIPDWSKIYGKTLRKSGGGGGSNGFKDDSSWAGGGGGDGSDDDDVDEYDGKVPPHEWIAKKLERSQISSFSVCEGVGRTLKGRDLSKVRNAVLSKTGFLE